MITTVNPCVAVNDGVSDFVPKVHLRGVKAPYTQTWWLRPPPFLMKGLIAYSGCLCFSCSCHYPLWSHFMSCSLYCILDHLSLASHPWFDQIFSKMSDVQCSSDFRRL